MFLVNYLHKSLAHIAVDSLVLPFLDFCRDLAVEAEVREELVAEQGKVGVDVLPEVEDGRLPGEEADRASRKVLVIEELNEEQK